MPLDTLRIRALCFDIDGTLADTDDQYVMKLAHWLSPFRILLKERGTLKAARWMVTAVETPANWLLGLTDRFGVDDDLTRAAGKVGRHSRIHASARYLLISGVREMLEVLHLHFPLSIISVRRHPSVLRFLDESSLARFFPVVASAHTCQHTKPYPDPVLWAASQMGVPAEACLMIGDTVGDIQAGRAAGAQTVGVLCGFGTSNELQKAGADLILDSTPELVSALGLEKRENSLA